ncbi:MAG TPA: PDZ domain-containing protein, partial [Syntrophobacteria bacterium]|nr:PDZ domain-containing protein [Syntrophobacteria bacterium]
GRDPKTDLALIKTKTKLDTSAVVLLGDSDKVQVGEWVMAIGNPFGLERTVTVGIISAKGRVIGAGPYDDFLQTDAAINPGNSGGPLFNMKGEVVGINTAIVASGQGIGFAIPINLARELLPQLEKGKVVRGWLGISIQDVTPEIAKSFNLKDTKGALVADVMKDSPAQKGGIERGDIVVSFDGKPIASAHELSRIVAGTPPNNNVKVEVTRNGKRQAFAVQVGTMPGEVEEEAKTTAAELGLAVQGLTPDLAEQFDWPREEKGVLITGVDPGSAADDAGLRRGDLIKEMDHKPVQTVDDYRRQVKKVKQGESILLLIKRGTQTFFVTVKKGSE